MSESSEIASRYSPCTTSTAAHTARTLEFAPLIPPEPIRSHKGVPKEGGVGRATRTRKGAEFNSRIPNAASREALEEIKTGKLKRYADEDELFRKLGIKVGKS